MELYTINSLESIKLFLYDIYKRYQNPFFPEDDFKDFVDEKGNRIFSDDEADYYDDVMLYCFVFCLDNLLDIHRIAEEVQTNFFMAKEHAQTGNALISR